MNHPGKSQRSRINLPIWARFLIGVPMLAIGIAIAGYMAASVILEIMTDDLFGMSVAALVVVFGCILVREGWFLLRGHRPARLNAQPSSHHLVAYARTNMHPEGEPPDPARCAAVVYQEWQCPNPRGHGPEGAFCRKHAALFAQPSEPVVRRG